MTRLRSRSATALALLVALTVRASPGSAADIAKGEQLAQRMCASCHLVSAAQRQGNADAPPFATMARMPNFSAERVAFFLLDPHPQMPALSLTRRETDDIAGYIASLAK